MGNKIEEYYSDCHECGSKINSAVYNSNIKEMLEDKITLLEDEIKKENKTLNELKEKPIVKEYIKYNKKRDPILENFDHKYNISEVNIYRDADKDMFKMKEKKKACEYLLYFFEEIL